MHLLYPILRSSNLSLNWLLERGPEVTGAEQEGFETSKPSAPSGPGNCWAPRPSPSLANRQW